MAIDSSATRSSVGDSKTMSDYLGTDLAFRDIGDGYFATYDGRILSSKSKAVRELAFAYAGDYAFVTIFRSGVSRRCSVHSLILTAFKGQRPSPLQQCRHLDGNPRNNRASNLEWGTAKENAWDRKRHGRDASGDRNSSARLSEANIHAIRAAYDAGKPPCQIALKFSTSSSLIVKIGKRRNWKSLPEQTGSRDPRKKSLARNVREWSAILATKTAGARS